MNIQNRKAKILYIVSTLKRAGPINILIGIIQELDREQFEPIVLTLSKEEKDSRIKDFLKMNVKIHPMNLDRISMALWGKSRIEKMIYSIKPDIIHTHGIRADTVVNKYIKGVPHCNTIHNYAYQDYPMTYGNIMGKAMANKHLEIFRNMKYSVACSYAISNKLKSIHKIETFTIQNGINDRSFLPCEQGTKNQLRKQLNLPQNKQIIVSVGHLSARKDPITIIEAFRQSNIEERAQLIFIGDGPLRQECEKKKGQSIQFTGRVSNVIDYLRTADIFVSASTAEGLPNSVLEAMGAGLPVILSDIEPHVEIVEANYNIGRTFNTRSITGLSHLLKKVEGFNLEKMGREARKTLESHFSSKVMSDKYQELYHRILRENI